MPAEERKEARPENQAPQVQLPVVRDIHFPSGFAWAVLRAEDGGRLLQFVTPNGDRLNFALDPEVAKQLGNQLTAPSIQVAGANELPPAPPDA